jgi:hypothetical protein
MGVFHKARPRYACGGQAHEAIADIALMGEFYSDIRAIKVFAPVQDHPADLPLEAVPH